MPYADPEKNRAAKLRSQKKREVERMAQGLCVQCGNPVGPICQSKRFCDEHMAASQERSRRWEKAQPAWYQAWRRRVRIQRMRIKIMRRLGGLVCAMCGEDDYRVLTIDHIEGHSVPLKERKARPAGLTAYDRECLREGTLDYSAFRVLCMNCQIRHEYSRGCRKLDSETWLAVLLAGGACG